MLTVHDLKGIAALSIFALTVFSGMIPFCLQSRRGFLGERIISLGNSMTAGIFLCMGFSHILYEAGQDAKQLGNSWRSSNLHFHIFMITFLIVFGFESLLGGAAHDPASQHIHDKPHDPNAPIQLQERMVAPAELKCTNIQPIESSLSDSSATEQNNRDSKTSLSFYMLIFALSFHSASTGLAMGVQSEYYSVIAILIGSCFLPSDSVSQID